MPIHASIESRFKSEVRASGRKLVAEEKITLSSGSDTTIQAYARAAPPVRTLLVSNGISSRDITAKCSCPAAAKRQLCKHIWGVLTLTSESFPDFLNGKTNIELAEADPESEADSTYEAQAKLRASTYRKEQYANQKARVKSAKDERKKRETAKSPGDYPAAVGAALEYFILNGFPMPDGPSEAVLVEAKRKLSRIFHPDKGGTHAEIVELNERCEAIAKYLGL